MFRLRPRRRFGHTAPMGRSSSHAVLAAAVCVAAFALGPAVGVVHAAKPEPTAGTYRAQANAICKNEEQELTALPSGLTLAVYLQDATAVARKSLTALKHLSPPSELASLHAQVLANIEAGFPIVSRLRVRAQAGKLTLTQFENDKALTRNVAREDGLWKQLGASVCASS